MSILNPRQRKAAQQLSKIIIKCGGTNGDAITVVNLAEELKKQEENQFIHSESKAAGSSWQPTVFDY